MSIIKEKAEACYDEIVGIRRQIHKHPEIGRNEFVTSALILNEKVTVMSGVGTVLALIGLFLSEYRGKTQKQEAI